LQICAEAFLIRNFLMDFLLLMLAARGSRFISPIRLMAASVFGAVYALFSVMNAFSILLDTLCACCMLVIAFPVFPLSLFFHSALSFLIFALLSGSTVRLTGGFAEKDAALFMGAVLLFWTAAFLKGAYRHRKRLNMVRMRITYLNRKAEFTAIVDTGNLLREPISALPVMIADERALGKDFVKCVSSDRDTRRVSFATVGGEGSILCLKAHGMYIYRKNRWVNAPDMWLGVLPGKIRSGVHALVPGSVFEN